MTSDSYKYGGARALVALHAKHLREFLATWRHADECSLELPASSDPSYASRELLLSHVLGCAARYLTWICEQLQIPAPVLEENPDAHGFAGRADEYTESVLAAWEQPLRELTQEVADSQVFEARWGTPYCIDAMLEHAVMHPLRHSHQLEELLAVR